MANNKQIAPRYIALAFAWAMFILFATIANVSTLTQLKLSDLFAFDKPIHMMLFGIQAILLIRIKSAPTTRWILYCCLASLAYGILTELLQAWLTTTRYFDYMDMVANFIGCILVYVWQARTNRVAS